MNYLQIAEESPEIICWAEASEVVLKRNSKTDSVGIKLDTFKVNIVKETKYGYPINFLTLKALPHQWVALYCHSTVLAFKNVDVRRRILLDISSDELCPCVLILVFVWVSHLLLLSSTSMSSTVLTAVTLTQTHQLLRERATKCYENCCDEECSLADVDGRARIFFPINVVFWHEVVAQSGF